MVTVDKKSPMSYIVKHAINPGALQKIHIRDLKLWYKPKPRTPPGWHRWGVRVEENVGKTTWTTREEGLGKDDMQS